MDVTVERRISQAKECPIRFGTDGWRGIIADEFTLDNVRTVSQALCLYLKEENPSTFSTVPLIVGFDTRFMSDRFARLAAQVAASQGFKVLFSERASSTPSISWAVKQHGALGAVMITASHNPPKYNGFKVKADYAGSASPKITARIESFLPRVDRLSEESPEQPIQFFDPRPDYFAQLAHLVDIERVLASPLAVIADCMFGAGAGYLPAILGKSDSFLREINDRRDPYFGGINPEPIPQNLLLLSAEVKRISNPLAVGLAFDGDADRIGAIDRDGSFISSHRILALLLRHLVEVKRWSGGVIKTVSTTRLVEKMASRYGLPLFETPIGFKYICDLMRSEDILIGGEESGGIGIKNHIPERDGVLCGLLLLEIMATHEKSLGELVAELDAEYGAHQYSRIDLHLRDNSLKEKVLKKLSVERPSSIEGIAVTDVSQLDGIKFSLGNGGWLLFRASGTEPVLRIYAESPTMGEVESLLGFGKRLVQSEENGR
ncbi:MAG TPA: phosphoglucomutase/phosphomannomutase family protein [Chroococcales cyanobacterium]